MNRVQAIKAMADKIGLSGPFTNNLGGAGCGARLGAPPWPTG